MRPARFWRVVFVVMFSLSLTPAAFAYLDPGTGTMIISAIIGLFAAAVLAVKTYWYKLTSLFKGRPPEGRDEAGDRKRTERE